MFALATQWTPTRSAAEPANIPRTSMTGPVAASTFEMCSKRRSNCLFTFVNAACSCSWRL